MNRIPPRIDNVRAVAPVLGSSTACTMGEANSMAASACSDPETKFAATTLQEVFRQSTGVAGTLLYVPAGVIVTWTTNDVTNAPVESDCAETWVDLSHAVNPNVAAGHSAMTILALGMNPTP